MSLSNGNPPAAPLDLGPAAPAASAPPGRPSWAGLLRLSLVAVPVQAFPAVRTPAVGPFHLLHAGCGQRIQYQKCCPRHGPVDAAAIVRAASCAPGQDVVVEPETLDRLRPARDRALVLEQFVPADAIDPVWFAGRSLYLRPDGPAARHPYAVLAAALHQAGRAGLGQLVLSGRRHLARVRAAGRLLVVDLLHYPAQVRAAARWEADLGGSAPSDQELHLAGMLMQASSGPPDWARYRDTRADELAALVQAKLANWPLVSPAPEAGAVRSLLEALRQSVAAARKASASPPAGARPPRAARRPRP